MAKLPVASDQSNMPVDDVVETSIARVLDAEAAALDAIARARDDAAAIAERAREEVRRIGLRTDRRVGALRAAFKTSVAAEIALLESAATALAGIHELTPAEVERVDRAVRATAEALTGGPP